MIQKTQRNFRRRVKTWEGMKYARIVHYHEEIVLRETWWLLGILPVYSREKIEATTI